MPRSPLSSSRPRKSNGLGVRRSLLADAHGISNFRIASTIAFFCCILAFCCETLLCQRAKLPSPRELDKDLQFQRDPSTGILHAVTAANTVTGNTNAGTIRVQVNLVPITCGVFGADGIPVRGLSRTDFRIFDNGAEQKIAYFDASEMPASVALLIDASPSVLRESAEMKQAAQAMVQSLSAGDQIAAVDFSEHSYLLLPFSSDRNMLDRAVARVDVRQLFNDTGGTNIYRAVYAATQLFSGRPGRKAIVLVTDGQDSGLGLTLDPASAYPRAGDPPDRLTFDDVARELAARNIQVFAISTENRPKIMTAAWIESHRTQSLAVPQDREWQIPAYTLYLAELVRRTGGELYFLNEAKTLAETYQRIATSISTEYVLGFYPAANAEEAGPSDSQNRAVHSLQVQVISQPGANVVNRATYLAQ